MSTTYLKRIVWALDRAHERRMARPASILPGELGRTLTSAPLTRHEGD